MQEDHDTLIIGDLNSRFGNAVQDFLKGKSTRIQMEYLPPEDKTKNPNVNARHTLSAMEPCILVNNLKVGNRVFKGGLTFHQKGKFISELDVCIVSMGVLDYIVNFEVDTMITWPSNHVPIHVSLDISNATLDISTLVMRADQLGSHAVHATTKDTPCVKNS